jgi:hypothetical protein
VELIVQPDAHCIQVHRKTANDIKPRKPLMVRTMRRRTLLMVVGTPLALIVTDAGAVLSVPVTRHLISARLHTPDRMPALSANSQVHYQPGAENFARDVAALLPDAIAQVEAVHGRPFAHPVIVGVYATSEGYAMANALGSTVPAGVTTFGQVNPSPKLFKPQHQRLRSILTHELSHAHIQGWIGQRAYTYLPQSATDNRSWTQHLRKLQATP